jgi:hypothetical protein
MMKVQKCCISDRRGYGGAAFISRRIISRTAEEEGVRIGFAHPTAAHRILLKRYAMSLLVDSMLERRYSSWLPEK